VTGVGEAGPLPGLSHDDLPDFDSVVEAVITEFNSSQANIGKIGPGSLEDIHHFIKSNAPSILKYASLTFAFEVALLDLINGGRKIIFKNSFVSGTPVPINGLIWMGGMDSMLQQIEIKIRDGFRCIKLKVGSINFERECDILQYVRRKYFRDDIIVRLDANGAFKEEDAVYKLNELSKFNIHSIEQPLRKGSPQLPSLCRDSPIPIALDEEIIGLYDKAAKEEILSAINPTFIILKPSLHGGLRSCQEWISIAEKKRIGWWLTSALESSLGLNALAQFVAEYPIQIHQGLGTGSIYENNISSPLEAREGFLRYNSDNDWDDLAK
jgi:o-succinylbenzoate synthase